MKSNKIDVVFGRECRRIHRAVPLNLSAKIFHAVIGNHYSPSLEISLYFEWFVKQMELHNKAIQNIQCHGKNVTYLEN